MSALKEAGCWPKRWYEAIEYSGEPKQLIFELSAKRGLFSNAHIAASDVRQSLESMARYLDNHPDCRNWKLSINERRLVAQNGDFMIVQRDAFKGGDENAVAEIVTRFGGDQEDVDFFLNTTGETVLGYVLAMSQRGVRSLAQIVHTGATGPGSREDVLGLVERVRQTYQYRAAAGDAGAGDPVAALDKLANYWKTVTDDLLHVKTAQGYYDDRNVDQAIAEYKKAISIAPNNADWHYGLGFLYAEQESFDQAAQQYEEAIRINPAHYEAYNGLGHLHTKLGKFGDAAVKLQEAIRINPTFAKPHGNLGAVYYHQGKQDEAIKEYNECLRLDPALGEVRKLLEAAQQEQAKVKAWQKIANTGVSRFWGITWERQTQLAKEWAELNTLGEPIRNRMTQADVDAFFNMIATSDDLTLDSKAVADFALLAVLEGSVPSPEGLSCLNSVFGSEFVAGVLGWQAQLAGDTNEEQRSP